MGHSLINIDAYQVCQSQVSFSYYSAAVPVATSTIRVTGNVVGLLRDTIKVNNLSNQQVNLGHTRQFPSHLFGSLSVLVTDGGTTNWMLYSTTTMRNILHCLSSVGVG